ncbi:MAG: endonuclease III [candidate division WOR-3 bacterium]
MTIKSKHQKVQLIFRRLQKIYPELSAPVKKMPRNEPWQVLVSAVLSTRTQDRVTTEVIKRLFCRAPDPQTLAKLNPKEVMKLIYPVGFYKKKAQVLPRLAKIIIDEENGKVPNIFKRLVRLPGVGRKVANIVLSQGFGIPAIAVDIHVHRIFNRLGLVSSQRPEETERKLQKILPKHIWVECNKVLVAFGQTVCLPKRPKCEDCPIKNFCLRCGVGKPTTGRGQRGKPVGMFAGKSRSGKAGN